MFFFRFTDLMCWGPPRHWKLPLTMMASLSHSASHSSMECEVRIIEVPDFRMLLIVSQIFLLAAGSTPVVGSSSNITFGLPMSARATFSFLLLPPEY